MSAELLLRELERTTSVPEAVRLIRPFIVQVALRGDLTADGRTAATRRSISVAQIASGMAELLGGRPSYRWRTDASGGTHASQQVPDGWTHACLNDTGLFINGLAFKPTDWGTAGRPIIRIQNLSGQNPTFNLTHRVVSPDNIVKDGDLLVSWSATLDTFVWRGPEGVLNQHIFKVIPNREAVTTGFLYWLLKHEVRQLAQSQHAHGLAMMHINRGPFLAHGVLLPPLEEQHRIVAKVDELMALCDELEAAHTQREAWRDRLRATSLRSIVAPDEPKENARFFLRHSARMITCSEHVAGVRQAVLDLAVRGRLVPQDPGDEPAARWIRRIAPTGANGGIRSQGRTASSTPIVIGPFPLPDGWCWSVLSALGQTQTGGTPPTQDAGSFGNDVPFIKPGDITARGIDYSGRGLSHAGFQSLGRKGSANTILMVCIGATLGKCGLLDRVCSFNQQINALSPHDLSSARYCFVAMQSPGFQDAAIAASAHGTLPILNKGRWQQLVLPIPPIAEQHRIVAKVDELMAVCDELEQSLATEQTERARLLEALLRDALEDALPARELELLGAR